MFVDQPADGEIWLIEPRSVIPYGCVDAEMFHRSQGRRKIHEQRIEPVVRIAMLIDPERSTNVKTPHQVGRGAMRMKVDDHQAHRSMRGQMKLRHDRPPQLLLAMEELRQLLRGK